MCKRYPSQAENPRFTRNLGQLNHAAIRTIPDAEQKMMRHLSSCGHQTGGIKHFSLRTELNWGTILA